jgi:hypothetical protein
MYLIKILRKNLLCVRGFRDVIFVVLYIYRDVTYGDKELFVT